MRLRHSWFVYVVAWIPFVASWGALVWLSRDAVGFAAAAALGMMGTAALLGAAVWKASDRYPWPRSGWPGRTEFVTRHLASALGYAAVLIGVDSLLGGYFEGKTALAFLRDEPRWVLWQILFYSWLYGLVAGIAYALRAQQHLVEREMALARAEARAAEAQLRALRAQLNPHFLFNTLHSLGTLVRHDRAAAEQALDRLGELLRYALDEGAGDSVTLADEWVFVRNYLALESLRLGSRLRVEAALDDEALDCRVPPFVLQPLVENAVRHAVAPRSEGGRLTISARVHGEHLRIHVEDDGPGASPEALKSAPGLGLRSLRQRLAATFDGASGLEIRTAPRSGFAATLTLPARLAES